MLEFPHGFTLLAWVRISTFMSPEFIVRLRQGLRANQCGPSGMRIPEKGPRASKTSPQSCLKSLHLEVRNCYTESMIWYRVHVWGPPV